MQRQGCRWHILIALFFLAPIAWASPKSEIRVRLKKQVRILDIEGFAISVAPPSGFVSASYSPKLMKVSIKLKQPGLWLVKWSENQIQKIEAEYLNVRGQMLRMNLEPVPYGLELIKNPTRGLDVVARLDIDSYLAGVLPAEMPVTWPLEALKAQAVAARSYALKVMVDRRDSHFDVDSTVIDQVYKFWHEGDVSPNFKGKVQRALESTKGEVLLDQRGRVLKAFFHADCGCQTEDPKFVWGAVSSFKSVKDPTCSKRKTHQWNLTLGRAEVREKLIEYFKLPKQSILRELAVMSRTPSGRVAQVAANFSSDGVGEIKLISAQNFRKVFGFEKVASSNFQLSWNERKLEVNGQGLGHGVGLCQWGARAAAADGSSYREILKRFYPLAKLQSPRNI